jgi:hypothetical protein
MKQVHNRLSDEQVKVLLRAYCQHILDRGPVQELLGLGKTQFFVLLKEYRRDPDLFHLGYSRSTPARLSPDAEAAIAQALLAEKVLVEDRRWAISDYNYSALRDRLLSAGTKVSLTTIIARARALGCYVPHAKHKVHDREVRTEAIGALVQHDASIHPWSPLVSDKWTLITSIDDYSRMLLFADLVPHETTWAHILAAQQLIQTYGLPLSYYVDSLRIFRFVQKRDSIWRNHVLETDDADPQWRQLMRLLNVDVIHALSPQAKGKVERPFRWLQDRVGRACYYDDVSTFDQVREVVHMEVDRYNNRQVHSTTGEIPRVRFEKAAAQGRSLFRPFSLPSPYTSPDDVFCLRMTRVVSTYRRIQLSKHTIPLPEVDPNEEVQVHLIPNPTTQSMALRIWWNAKLVHTTTLPLNNFRVHF